MLAVHRVLRRESGLLPRLVRAVRPGDTARAGLVAGHYHRYALGLAHHHAGEDELIRPLLLARVDLDAELVLRMEEQHRRIAAGLEIVVERLPEWERTAAPMSGAVIAAALDAHRVALVEHLTEEEDHLVPLIEEHLTATEYARLHELFVARTPSFLGALLEDATPVESAEILRHLPIRSWLSWFLAGRWRHARATRRLRKPLASST